MRIFLLIYTLVMVAGSIVALSLAPRSLRDLGHERERLQAQLPEISYERMVNAGYRFNFLILLLEIAYYYLLIDFGGPERQIFYGGAFFGLVHIGYLVTSRLEKRRLSREYGNRRLARVIIWLTAALTTIEIGFLVMVLYLLAAAP